MVLQSLKESPTGARPAFERNVEAESAHRIARLGERVAAYSATVRSLHRSCHSSVTLSRPSNITVYIRKAIGLPHS